MTERAPHEKIARAVWKHLTRTERTKADIAARVNRGRGTPIAPVLMFDSETRLYLEHLAQERGEALVIERGFVYRTTRADAAERRNLREIRRNLTQAENFASPGNGRDLLINSRFRDQQQLGAVMLGMANSATTTRTIVESLATQQQQREREARARARQAERERRAEDRRAANAARKVAETSLVSATEMEQFVDPS
jgi:hypothetical protein